MKDHTNPKYIQKITFVQIMNLTMKNIKWCSMINIYYFFKTKLRGIKKWIKNKNKNI